VRVMTRTHEDEGKEESPLVLLWVTDVRWLSRQGRQIRGYTHDGSQATA